MVDSRNSHVKNRAVIMGVFISLIILSYQNCGRVQQNGAPVTEIQTGMQLSNSNEVKLLKNEQDQNGPYVYKVNLRNKTVEKRYYEVPAGSPEDVLLATYCLNEEWSQRLQNIFDEASICEYEAQVSPGTACTMVYTYPHSIVAVDSQNLKLGERTSGCSGYMEICGDQRENFRYVTQSLLNEIETLTCN